MKRITIELDDNAGRGPTDVPEDARREPLAAFKSRSATTVPGGEKEEVADAKDAAKVQQKAPGRSYADLFAEFIYEPRVVVVLLLFLPIVAFSKKINSVADLGLPLLIGAGLVFVWFLVGWITKKMSK